MSDDGYLTPEQQKIRDAIMELSIMLSINKGTTIDAILADGDPMKYEKCGFFSVLLELLVGRIEEMIERLENE